MRQTRPPPEVGIEAIIGVFLTEALYPEQYVRHFEPWHRLIKKPNWRHAKPLLAEHADRVSVLVERLFSEHTGSRDAAAWMCLGKVRLFRGDHERALEAFRLLVDRDPRDIRARYNAGLCLVALGRADEARQSFLRVLEFSPGDERATRALAELS